MPSASNSQVDLFELDDPVGSNLKSALTKAYRLLSQRSRSEKELRNALKKAGCDEKIVNSAIEACKRQRFIDDAGFARQFIQSRLRNRPMGRERLALELKQKGIAAETIEAALDETFADETGLALADQLADKQRQKLAALPAMKARQKLADFLRRRGFDWETIQATQLWKELSGNNHDQ